MESHVSDNKNMKDTETLQTNDTTIIEGSSELERRHGNGDLNRGLKSRHIQFIALGGTIGTGLFLGLGSALITSGPLSLLLGYVATSAAIWAMVFDVP